MDPELRQALSEMEGRIIAHVDQRIADVERRLRIHIDEQIAHVNERIEATETKLLTAFHTWAQTYEVRARGTAIMVREFDERLGLIEERLARLERRTN